MAKQWMDPDALFRMTGQSWECPEMRDRVRLDRLNGGGTPPPTRSRKAVPKAALVASWSSSPAGTG